MSAKSFWYKVPTSGGKCSSEGLYKCIKQSLENIKRDRKADPHLQDDKLLDYFIERELDRFAIKARRENKFDTCP